MILNALNDKLLPVYGNGENVRDRLYVEDHFEAIDLIHPRNRTDIRFFKFNTSYQIVKN